VTDLPLPLDEVLAPFLPDTAPGVLYHYTDQAGLLGILRTRAIWLTDIRLLNDEAEFTYTYRLGSQVLEGISSLFATPEEQALHGAMLEAHRLAPLSYSAYVASFCESGDLLSQWRGYGGRGAGYAIGFSPNYLIRHSLSSHTFLVRCEYDPPVQVRIFHESVIRLLKAFRSRCSDQPTASETRDLFAAGYLVLLMWAAAAFKDPAFKEEAEWRLVRIEGNTDVPLEFRPGPACPIPYVPGPLAHAGTPLELEALIVGPHRERALAQNVITALLRHIDVECSEVRSSQAPFRS
jgi:hypothetical protein